jgi:rare lipoprotein A
MAPTDGVQVGGASYYGGGGRTASGGAVGAATCAHRTLPFGTRVLVTNLNNARRAVLTVNDRGPFVAGRIVDVSVGAAASLGMLHSGTARVSVQVVGGPG